MVAIAAAAAAMCTSCRCSSSVGVWCRSLIVQLLQRLCRMGGGKVDVRDAARSSASPLMITLFALDTQEGKMEGVLGA